MATTSWVRDHNRSAGGNQGEYAGNSIKSIPSRRTKSLPARPASRVESQKNPLVFSLPYSAANSAKTRLNTDSHRVESTNMFHVQRDVQTPITTSINTFVGRWRSAVEATVSTSFLRMG